MKSKTLREQFEKSTKELQEAGFPDDFEIENLIAIARESIEALERSEDTIKLLRGIIQKYENVLIRRKQYD